MAVSDTAVSISTFLGLNDSIYSSKTALGEARGLVNFTITDDGKLRKRKGFQLGSQNSVEGKALDIVFFATQTMYNFSFLVLTETALWGFRFQNYTFVKVYERKSAGKGKCFVKDDKLYLVGGEFTCFDNHLNVVEPEIYIPTIAINKSPSGTVYEPFEKENALTDLVSEEFITDGSSPYFLKYKTACDITVSECRYPVTAAPGEEAGSFTVSPPLPAGTKVKVTYRVPELSQNKNEILNCNRAVFFGGNLQSDLFLWNSSKNRRYYSYGGNVGYFPIDNSDEVGSSGMIYDMICHYGQMVIFTSSGIFVSSLCISENGDVSYPLSLLNGTAFDLKCPALIADNVPVFLTGDKLLRLVSTAEKSEKNVVTISDRVSAALKRASFEGIFNLKTKNELWITSDSTVIVWNYKNDVFYTLEGLPISNIFEQGTSLKFIDNDGYLCEFNDIYVDITPSDERRPIDAYCYLEGIDFGTSFRKKQLTDVFIKTGLLNGGEISVIGDVSESPTTYEIKTGYRSKKEQITRIGAKKERFYTLDLLIRSQKENEELNVDEVVICATKLYTVNRR